MLLPPGSIRALLIQASTSTKGIEYDVVDLSQDDAALAQAKELGYLQAPVVITDEDHWAGFRPDKIDELAARLA